MTSAATPPAAVPSWRPGRRIWPDGQTKLVLVGGLGSRTGDVEQRFSELIRSLQQHGYRPERDVLEGSYAGRADAEGRWVPRPYGPPDTRQPLEASAEAVAGSLEWYRERLPRETRFCIIGYSLGGVIGLDGATLAVARDRAGWRGRIAALVTIAAPVLGCNAGPFIHWAWIATPDLEPLGATAVDLERRWTDPHERERVERRAAFLRAGGARVLTFADPDDAVVRPDEALLPEPGASADDLLLLPPPRRGLPSPHGHGAILLNPILWRRVFEAIGPQTFSTTGTASAASQPDGPDPLDLELQAMKARLRAEGRIPSP